MVDPTKVTRSALQNAASICGLLLTTECLIADIPKEEAGADPHSHSHAEMGMQAMVVRTVSVRLMKPSAPRKLSPPGCFVFGRAC